MKNFKVTTKLAVLMALTIPVGAEAALTYTPPQAIVVTCNGQAPKVLKKNTDLAQFSCTNGAKPQAVGITNGLGGLLGLASGAALFAGSEALPGVSLPGASGPVNSPVRTNNGSGNSGNNGSNGSNNGSGNASNGSGNGNNGSGNGSGSGTGNGSSSGSGSNSGAGSNTQGSGTGSGSSANGSDSGSGNGSGNGSGSGSGNGSQLAHTGEQAAQSGGGWLGNIVGNLGHALGQIGHAVATGGTVTVPLFGGQSGQSETQGSNQNGNGSSPFSRLNPAAPSSSSQTLNFMTGSKTGTVGIHTQPQMLTFTGGDQAYRGLVQWVAGYENELDTAQVHLDEVVHPGTITHERLDDGGNNYTAYEKMTGTVDFYLIEDGHRYAAYPGNPVRFVSSIAPRGNQSISVWIGEMEAAYNAMTIYSSGPQNYTSVPGNRNGPFWPSHLTIGQPEENTAGVCHGIQEITHVSMGAYCWSSEK